MDLEQIEWTPCWADQIRKGDLVTIPTAGGPRMLLTHDIRRQEQRGPFGETGRSEIHLMFIDLETKEVYRVMYDANEALKISLPFRGQNEEGNYLPVLD